MSAQPSQYATIRLLIAEKSENAAFELDSALRNHNIATKLLVSDDLAHIGQLLQDGALDLVLFNDQIEGLAQALPRFRDVSPLTPMIILASEEPSRWSIAETLALGATDLVPADSLTQLSLVVSRELRHVAAQDDFTRIEAALIEAERRCQLLLQESSAAIAYVHEGMHIHANEKYLGLFGYNDAEDLSAVSLVDLLSAESGTELKTQLKALRQSDIEASFDFSGHHRLGHAISGSMMLKHTQYEAEPCLQVTVNSAGVIPELAPEDTAITPEHSVDVNGFTHRANTLCQTDSRLAYVLICGLDNYHDLQLAYGLSGTETICQTVWEQVQQWVPDCPITRPAQQYFGLAIGVKRREDATEIAEKLRSGVDDMMFEVRDKTVRPTISISGMYIEDNEPNGADTALEEAFARLMQMSDMEKINTVSIPTIAEESAGFNSGDARIVLRHVNEAIDKKSFVLLFQPIISLRGDADEHYEVFLRMKDHDGELIQPARFLQTAIDNNVAGKIDRWVILQAIKTLSVHRAKGHPTRLTINLTANSVVDPDFMPWLEVAIRAARLPSDALVFQITEKDATTYLRQTGECMDGLRNLHFRTSLSRFGLVDNPFETFDHVNVDIVKLDGAQVGQISGNQALSGELVATIKELQAAGKLTVVPMVENATVLSTLWQAGANYIQGHYLQEPSLKMEYDFGHEE